jgi:hypothetical protein
VARNLNTKNVSGRLYSSSHESIVSQSQSNKVRNRAKRKIIISFMEDIGSPGPVRFCQLLYEQGKDSRLGFISFALHT